MIVIKTEKEIAVIRMGGKILANIIRKLVKEINPGITTGQLEQIACELIKKAGGVPSFKGYKSMLESKAFPTALCSSINNEVVHSPALPSRRLDSGDIIGIDLGMEYPVDIKSRQNRFGRYNSGGYFTDMAVTVGVGKIDSQSKKLIKVAKKSLELAIAQVKPGNTLDDIGRAVEDYVEKNGFSVVRDLVGHGVGMAVHEEPQVPNFSIKHSGIRNITLKPGMVIAIEPMVNAGAWEIKSLEDGFTIATADGQRSAHFEHTVAVVEGGHKILTEA